MLSILSRAQGTLSIATQDMLDADTRGFRIDSSKSSIYAAGVIPETILITGSNFGPLNSGGCRLASTLHVRQRLLQRGGAEQHLRRRGPRRDVESDNCDIPCQRTGSRANSADSFNATNCTVSVAHTQIRCDFNSGTTKAHEWIVTVGMQDSLALRRAMGDQRSPRSPATVQLWGKRTAGSKSF